MSVRISIIVTTVWQFYCLSFLFLFIFFFVIKQLGENCVPLLLFFFHFCITLVSIFFHKFCLSLWLLFHTKHNYTHTKKKGKSKET
ncbi:hypothetical protein STCU_11861 [Strigomonas culicis]|uniref:Uncharacterized protein n=1 Tax=Strigomonas culicis TaxID=28005 RepID=S9TCC5_9TRYP|nr:hypothetical protein STCU_11861 [Strigomonas culicis]|eukprot:EPY15652.1 hypothetical protein STCU_11861 [Strigomonas culicis]